MIDIRRMQLGQVIDFVIDYNERNKQAEKTAKRKRRRKASQGDINAFFG